MKKIVFLLIVLFCNLYGKAQETNRTVDIRTGIGLSLFGDGDMTMLMFEQELTKKYTPYISTSAALNFGYSITGIHDAASVMSTDINLFVSPLKNNKNNNFKIGLGATYTYQHVVQMNNPYATQNNYIQGNEFSWLSKYSRWGFVASFEDEFIIKERFLLGFKLSTHGQWQGAIFSGLSVRVGYTL